MTTLLTLMLMASTLTVLGAFLRLRGCICACVICLLSLIVGLGAIA